MWSEKRDLRSLKDANDTFPCQQTAQFIYIDASALFNMSCDENGVNKSSLKLKAVDMSMQ